MVLHSHRWVDLPEVCREKKTKMNHKELKARDEVKITIQTLKMKSNKCQSDRQKKNRWGRKRQSWEVIVWGFNYRLDSRIIISQNTNCCVDVTAVGSQARRIKSIVSILLLGMCPFTLAIPLALIWTDAVPPAFRITHKIHIRMEEKASKQVTQSLSINHRATWNRFRVWKK